MSVRIIIDSASDITTEGAAKLHLDFLPLKTIFGGEEFLERRKKEVRLIALLDTLEYLKRGGRISKTAAFAGNLLSIKPVIAIVDGEVTILGKARGSKNGNQVLWKDQVDELPVTSIGSTIGTHAGPGAIGVSFFAKPLN